MNMTIDDKYYKDVPIELLTEKTMDELSSSTNGAFPTRSDNINNVRIINKQYEQYDADKLSVKAKCAGETGTYDTSVLFEGVQFTDPGNPESITLHGGINILPLDSNTVDVKVRCSCLDFHWTFAWQNSGEDSLIGDPPPPYQKTTDRPPRNPTNAIGLCKHLLKLQSDMRAEGLLN